MHDDDYFVIMMPIMLIVMMTKKTKKANSEDIANDHFWKLQQELLYLWGAILDLQFLTQYEIKNYT